jgi:glycine cleavage system transcriptional repressor
MKEYIVSVLVRDRVGIVAGIARAVWELKGNILELSQTVVRGYFTIILSVGFEDDTAADTLREAVRSSGAPGEMEVAVRERGLTAAPPAGPNAERFVLTVLGKDKPGIICQMCSHLAAERINISDFYGKVTNGAFEMIVELEMPPDKEPVKLKTELERIGQSFGLRAHCLHENLFAATNSVRPVRIFAGGKP